MEKQPASSPAQMAHETLFHTAMGIFLAFNLQHDGAYRTDARPMVDVCWCLASDHSWREACLGSHCVDGGAAHHPTTGRAQHLVTRSYSLGGGDGFRPECGVMMKGWGNPLHYAAMRNDTIGITHWLMAAPASQPTTSAAPASVTNVHMLNQLNTQGYSPLGLAVQHGNVAAVGALLSIGGQHIDIHAGIAVVDGVCTRPLHIAIDENETEILALLVAHPRFLELGWLGGADEGSSTDAASGDGAVCASAAGASSRQLQRGVRAMASLSNFTPAAAASAAAAFASTTLVHHDPVVSPSALHRYIYEGCIRAGNLAVLVEAVGTGIPIPMLVAHSSAGSGTGLGSWPRPMAARAVLPTTVTLSTSEPAAIHPSDTDGAGVERDAAMLSLLLVALECGHLHVADWICCRLMSASAWPERCSISNAVNAHVRRSNVRSLSDYPNHEPPLMAQPRNVELVWLACARSWKLEVLRWAERKLGCHLACADDHHATTGISASSGIGEALSPSSAFIDRGRSAQFGHAVFAEAARAGKSADVPIVMLEHLWKCGFRPDRTACTAAASAGSAEALQWLKDHGLHWPTGVFQCALTQGRLRAAQWAVDNDAATGGRAASLSSAPPPGLGTDASFAAAPGISAGAAASVPALRPPPPPPPALASSASSSAATPPPRIFATTAISPRTGLPRHTMSIGQISDDRVCAWALQSSSLVARRCADGTSCADVVDDCLSSTQMDPYKWVTQILGRVPGPEAFVAAARAGNLRVLARLHAAGIGWPASGSASRSNIFRDAARNGHVHVLRWAWDLRHHHHHHRELCANSTTAGVASSSASRCTGITGLASVVPGSRKGDRYHYHTPDVQPGSDIYQGSVCSGGRCKRLPPRDLHTFDGPLDTEAVRLAASAGRTECVAWLIEHGFPWGPACGNARSSDGSAAALCCRGHATGCVADHETHVSGLGAGALDTSMGRSISVPSALELAPSQALDIARVFTEACRSGVLQLVQYLSLSHPIVKHAWQFVAANGLLGRAGCLSFLRDYDHDDEHHRHLQYGGIELFRTSDSYGPSVYAHIVIRQWLLDNDFPLMHGSLQ